MSKLLLRVVRLTGGHPSGTVRAVVAVGEDVLDRRAWLATEKRLPVWPLGAIFALMPLWWGLGVWYFVMPFFGLMLFVLMATRGRIRLPAGTALWLVFLSLVAVSVTRLDQLNKALTFGLRMGYLITGFMVGLYVYNLIRDGVPWAKVANPLAVYWIAVVALGWLGVVAPRFGMTSPFQHALPGSLRTVRFITDLSHLDSTEYNASSDNPIYRPAAPYPYTNNWGTAYAFLVPFVLAYLASVRHGRMRIALLISLPLSLVPAFFTLNRGMFIGLGAGVAYLMTRELVHGRVRLLVPVAGLLLSGWIFTLFIPVGDLIAARTSTTDTNLDRFDLYRQTWAAVLQSPLLGFGQPASVDTTHAAEPLGTQGMIWQVLYSHGIPATICLYLLLAVIARRMAVAITPAGRWLSMLPVIAIVVTPFYAYIDPNMSVLTFSIALGLAAVDGPVNRETPQVIA